MNRIPLTDKPSGLGRTCLKTNRVDSRSCAPASAEGKGQETPIIRRNPRAELPPIWLPQGRPREGAETGAGKEGRPRVCCSPEATQSFRGPLAGRAPSAGVLSPQALPGQLPPLLGLRSRAPSSGKPGPQVTAPCRAPGLLPSGHSRIVSVSLPLLRPPGGDSSSLPASVSVSSTPGPSARIRHSRCSVSIDQGTNSCTSALGACKVTPDISGAGRACKCQFRLRGLGLPDTGA